MTINPSPNVDRLSIDERLRKLEARFPGGGGGGNFSGTLPDFDQFPDNAIKLTNEGMVLKFSFDNVGTTFNCQYLPGVEVKSCAFMPYHSGILCPPIFIFGRIRYKNNLNDFQTQGNQSFSAQVPFDISDYKDNLMYTDPYLGPLFWYGLEGNGMAANNGKIINFAPMFFAANVLNLTSPNLTFQMSIYKLRLSQQAMSPCYNFGAAFLYDFGQIVRFGSAARPIIGSYGAQMSVGGYNSGQNISVRDLNNLPAQIRNIYPQSWLVP